jgi:hypothetical protein
MRYSIIIMTLMLGFLVSCTIVTQQTDQSHQRTQLETREFQTRVFDTDDTKLVMKAMLNVLQDEGFVVKNAVTDLGLLSATKEIDLTRNRGSNDFWSEFFESMSKRNDNQNIYKKFKIVEASVNVSEFGKQSKVRANFQAKVLDNAGNTVEVYQVDDPKYYQDFFSKVDKGIFIQKQGL